MGLREMLAICPDFLHEEGMLEHVAKTLGATVMLTPKCHAEIAGEGVEYMWACAKNTYRNLPLKEKKGKEQFNKSVRHSCLSDKVVTVERVRKFARRARQYLLAYHAIDSGNVDKNTQEDCAKYGPVALEKLVSDFKTHRCALDFAYRFIRAVVVDPVGGVA
jgi:hypothetical protein